MNFTKTAVWDGPGLKITLSNNFLLRVEDLNPEQKIAYRLTRWEAFRLSLWIMRRAVSLTTEAR